MMIMMMIMMIMMIMALTCLNNDSIPLLRHGEEVGCTMNHTIATSCYPQIATWSFIWKPLGWSQIYFCETLSFPIVMFLLFDPTYLWNTDKFSLHGAASHRNNNYCADKRIHTIIKELSPVTPCCYTTRSQSSDNVRLWLILVDGSKLDTLAQSPAKG